MLNDNDKEINSEKSRKNDSVDDMKFNYVILDLFGPVWMCMLIIVEDLSSETGSHI